MAIERYDLNACIGCRNCINICPMDVYRFDETANKSIIAYPENCQACGMCYYACLGQSLQLTLHSHMFPVVPMSATHGMDANYFISAAPNLPKVEERLGKYGEYASEPQKPSTMRVGGPPAPAGISPGQQAPPPRPES
jgi:NAD-dependent dihydropyrimidine dehydrogenase PreA subunit